MAPTRSWSVWAATHDRLSTQLYICNYHNKWDAPFSVAEYRVMDEILDGECGFWGGYIHFNAWRMSIGRDPTYPMEASEVSVTTIAGPGFNLDYLLVTQLKQEVSSTPKKPAF